MNREESLNNKASKAAIWYTFGNILLKGCLFLSLPIFTGLLSTSDFGIYNTYMAYEGLLVAILGLGIYGTVKNAKIDFEERFDQYLSSVLTLSILFFILILIIANLTYFLYETLIGFSRLIVNCLIFQSFGAFLIFFYGAKLNIEFKYKSYIFISCFNTLGNIGISVILIKYIFPNQRYLGRILGTAIPLFILSIILITMIYVKGKKFYDNYFWKYCCSIGLPLIPHVVSQSLLSQFDRVMINNLVGTSEAGIYSYIYTVCSIMFVISSSFDNAWAPWVYMKLKCKNEAEIRSASKKYIKIFTLLTLGFICVMPEITKIMANREYWSGIDLLIPLTLANYFIFLYQIPVCIEYFNKKTKYISIGTLIAAALNLVLNYIFICLYGFKAAAYTTLLSYISLFIFHWIIAKKYKINKIYSIKHIINNSICLVSLSFIILVTNDNFLLNLIIRYTFVIFIIIYCLRYKQVIFKIMKGQQNGN